MCVCVCKLKYEPEFLYRFGCQCWKWSGFDLRQIAKDLIRASSARCPARAALNPPSSGSSPELPWRSTALNANSIHRFVARGLRISKQEERGSISAAFIYIYIYIFEVPCGRGLEYSNSKMSGSRFTRACPFLSLFGVRLRKPPEQLWQIYIYIYTHTYMGVAQNETGGANRRFWSMSPLTRVPFWVPAFLSHSHLQSKPPTPENCHPAPGKEALALPAVCLPAP